MKKLFILPLVLNFALHLSAQQEWYYFPDEIYFVKEVPAKEFRGKHFKYNIAVQSNAADTFSRVRINGIAVGKGPNDFLNNSGFVKTSSKENNWTIYTIEGTIPNEAWKLWFYSAVNGNGDFYFDNIEFYVQENGEWIQVELINASFEENLKNIFQGYYVSNRKSPHLDASLSTQTAFHGQQSLHIHTFGLLPTLPKSITRQ